MDYLLDNELTSEYDVASCNTYFLRSTFLVAGTKELNSFHSSRLPFGICRSFYNHLLLARLFDMRSVLPPMRYRAFFYITVYYHVLQFQNIRGNPQTGPQAGLRAVRVPILM